MSKVSLHHIESFNDNYHTQKAVNLVVLAWTVNIAAGTGKGTICSQIWGDSPHRLHTTQTPIRSKMLLNHICVQNPP